MIVKFLNSDNEVIYSIGGYDFEVSDNTWDSSWEESINQNYSDQKDINTTTISNIYTFRLTVKAGYNVNVNNQLNNSLVPYSKSKFSSLYITFFT